MRYPPSRTAPAHAAISAYARDRMDEYLHLRLGGVSREAAARRMNLTLRTTYRYDARHRAGDYGKAA